MAATAPKPPTERLLPPPPRRSAPDFSIATVNIVLLLVLFFLVAGSIVAESEQGFDLPETTDLPLADLPRPLIVLQPGGETLLDGARLDPAAITERLLAEGAGTAHVLTARDMPARALMDLLAALEPAGLETSLITLRSRALWIEPGLLAEEGP